ncbi:MAG: UvrD-helicase domain-containing protein [Bacteroidales bacterium]|nr:UvrD-helicase domain-containing protein [Bacteroidales bacterium]
MLTVYSASAGSGKTYNLVFDYLACCFRRNLSGFLRLADRRGYVCPSCSGYQQILAITFTNNAGAEMKERVVQWLHRLAFAESGSDLAPNDFQNLCRKVFGSGHGLSEEECFVFLHENAKTLLHNILYDYARFSITTIDSFIQRVIRSSALYLNLSMNYAVQIQLTDFFQMAIEQYICELASNNQQFNVVVQELMEQLEDQGSANISRFLSKGLGVLYYDAEKSHPFVKNFPDFDHLMAVTNQWKKNQYQILELSKQQVQPLAAQAVAVFKTAEGVGIMPNGTMKWDKWFAQVAEDPFSLEKGFESSRCHRDMDTGKVFTVKGSASEKKRLESLKESYAEQVQDLFSQIQDIVLKNAKKYFTNRVLARNANPLLVLNALKNHIEIIKEQTDSFFLSESNPLLNDEILSPTRGEPVFEKMHFYKNFFIDEFQDTSLMQWQDLKPLIINALGEGGTLTLFGDVKQSIYRFRNGEAELFYRLLDRNRLQSAAAEKDIANMVGGQNDFRFEPLDTNFRSRSSVIAFNNQFFRYYAEKLGQDAYYADVEQKIREDKQGGLVQIYGYNKKDFKDIRKVWPECTEAFYQDIYLQLRPEEAELLYAVMDARRRGYSYGDMAVLLRGRAKCNDFARCLMLAEIPVITSESLQLIDNPNINLIISTLRYLVNANDTLSQTVIIDYFAHRKSMDFGAAIYQSRQQPFVELMEQYIGIQDFGETVERWLRNPFMVTVKEIVRFYQLSRDADPFVADFLDLVYDFTQSHVASVADFLVWWDDINCYGETIPRLSLPKTSGAVRLMTIHSSKGLEFPVVITHCTASSGSQASRYWVTDPATGQSCYVSHHKDLQYSDFQQEYEEEEKKKSLDGLNLWYVDFTRARDMLYILADFSESKSKTTDKPDDETQLSIKKALKLFLNGQNIESSDVSIYSFGDIEWHNPSVSNVEEPKDSDFRVSCSDLAFLDNESLKVELSEESSEQQNVGTYIHNFLQKLTHFPSTKEECEALTASEPEEIRERLLHLFENEMQDPVRRPYFHLDEGDVVLNEVSIITEKGEVRRPDRIVIKPDHVMIIDYKTGKEYHDKYERQLAEYKHCLEEMGYEDVRTDVLYVE